MLFLTYSGFRNPLRESPTWAFRSCQSITSEVEPTESGNMQLVSDWLITSHVTSIMSSDWLFNCFGRFLELIIIYTLYTHISRTYLAINRNRPKQISNQSELVIKVT
eukprot:sb/3477633/